MCGRYTLSVPESELVETFEVPAPEFVYRPRYNIAPGQRAVVVARDREGRRLGELEWGFLPSWKEEPSGAFINARAESVATKSSFREAFRRRRCLAPADGFYEWRPEGGGKVPYWIHPREPRLISFAGIWESWKRPGHEPRHTFAILTTDANSEVSEVHDRMPVLIGPEQREAWLDRSTAVERLQSMLGSAPDGSFELRRVSTRVNRPDDDDPGLVEAVEEGRSET